MAVTVLVPWLWEGWGGLCHRALFPCGLSSCTWLHPMHRFLCSPGSRACPGFVLSSCVWETFLQDRKTLAAPPLHLASQGFLGPSQGLIAILSDLLWPHIKSIISHWGWCGSSEIVSQQYSKDWTERASLWNPAPHGEHTWVFSKALWDLTPFFYFCYLALSFQRSA